MKFKYGRGILWIPAYAGMTILLVIFFTSPTMAGKSQKIEVIGGTPIPGYGLAIDASYDNKLDNLIPNYKVVSTAIINESFNIIDLNPKADKWWIQLGTKKKKIPAIADLRGENSTAWHALPEHARKLIAYPLALPIGARQIIDLFVPAKIPIEEFTAVIIYIDSLKTTFRVIVRQ